MIYQIDQSGKLEDTNRLTIDLEPTDSLVIDKEYPGHEESIKGILINLFRKQERTAPVIRFDNVGKTSPAHKAALDVFRGNSEADLIVLAKDVLGLLYQSG